MSGHSGSVPSAQLATTPRRVFSIFFRSAILGAHIVEMLCAEPMGIGAACVARVVGEAEKCPDVVEAETKLSRSANEAQPLQIRQAIEPMPAAVRAGERRTPAFS
jgi:hypothetical protein